MASVSLSVPALTVVVPVNRLLEVGASTHVPAPIFWSLSALSGIAEIIVLSAILVPPRTKVLAPVTPVMVPLIVRGPVPLALRKALTVVVLIVIGRLRVAAGPV